MIDNHNDDAGRDPLLDLPREAQIDLLAVNEGLARGFMRWASAAAESGQLAEFLAAFMAGDGYFLLNCYRISFLTERPATGEGIPDTPAELLP